MILSCRAPELAEVQVLDAVEDKEAAVIALASVPPASAVTVVTVLTRLHACSQAHLQT